MAEDGYSRAHSAIFEIYAGDQLLCWAGVPDSDAPFMSVYAHGRRKNDSQPPGTGNVRSYRLSMSGDRWAYGEAPYGAATIKLALAGLGIWSGGKLI